MSSRNTRQRWQRSPAWLPHAIFVVVGVLAAAAAAGWILYQLSTLVYMLFLALFVSIALEPAVQRLERWGWRRRRATMVVFAVALILVVGFFVALIPVFISQGATLIENVPEYLEALQDLASRYFQIDLINPDVAAQFEDLGTLLQRYGSAVAGGVFAVGNTVFGLIFQLVTVALFAYYLVAEGPTWRRVVLSFMSPERQREALNIWEVSVAKTGAYVYSRALLALVAGGYTFIVLAFLGVPSAAALAIWMGVLSQFVPVIGTYIGLVLPALAALAVRPITALWVVVALVAYQQLENYLIAPRITSHTMEIHPAVTIAALIAGVALLGGVGAILALPVTATVQALISTAVHRQPLIESEHLQEDLDENPGEPVGSPV